MEIIFVLKKMKKSKKLGMFRIFSLAVMALTLSCEKSIAVESTSFKDRPISDDKKLLKKPAAVERDESTDESFKVFRISDDGESKCFHIYYGGNEEILKMLNEKTFKVSDIFIKDTIEYHEKKRIFHTIKELQNLENANKKNSKEFKDLADKIL
jgi:hypothetical protein